MQLGAIAEENVKLLVFSGKNGRLRGGPNWLPNSLFEGRAETQADEENKPGAEMGQQASFRNCRNLL